MILKGKDQAPLVTQLMNDFYLYKVAANMQFSNTGPHKAKAYPSAVQL